MTVSFNNMGEKDIIVSIRCLAYNHEEFIRDCLDGFVMQRTDFRFEAIVHDDASTDKTPEIIQEYAKKYPDIIKPIFETENQYSKHDGSLGRIMAAACKGKYIAMCEGDDYWTDPLKLQKQVVFLESHEDFSMCFHAAEVKNEGEVADPYRNGTHFLDLEDREYTSTELVSKWMVPTASIVYRRDLVEQYQITHPEWLVYGDIVLALKCSHTGKIYGMSDVMSVYRIQPNSVTNNAEFVDRTVFKLPDHYRCLRMNFPKVEKGPLEWSISHSYFVRMKRQPNAFLKFCDFVRFFCWDPKQALGRMKRVISKR